MDKRDAALFAGYSPTNIPEDRPSKRISTALQGAGVTDDRLAKVVSDGLDAKNRFGTIDHNAVTKYLALVGKWLGFDKDTISVQVGLNFAGQVTDPQKLKDAIKIIEAEIVNRETLETQEIQEIQEPQATNETGAADSAQQA